MLKIYSNQTCSKSQCAIQSLQNAAIPFEVIDYIATPPTVEELTKVLNLLKKRPLEIIRDKETLFLENFKGAIFSDEEWIRILTLYPILIQRPIVVSAEKAWLARDEESLEEILKINSIHRS
jgi:arsenate reductase (glutaredoxin)